MTSRDQLVLHPSTIACYVSRVLNYICLIGTGISDFYNICSLYRGQTASTLYQLQLLERQMIPILPPSGRCKFLLNKETCIFWGKQTWYNWDLDSATESVPGTVGLHMASCLRDVYHRQIIDPLVHMSPLTCLPSLSIRSFIMINKSQFNFSVMQVFSNVFQNDLLNHEGSKKGSR